MSKSFEESVSEKQLQEKITAAVLKDREERKILEAQEFEFAEAQRLAEVEAEERRGGGTYYHKENGVSARGVTFDLRSEVDSQMRLLKSIRNHFFYDDGTPRDETESSDITSYMANTTKLLSMLKGFEDSLKTDADVLKIETAVEMALEDCPCEEFVTSMRQYLAGDLI